MGERGEESRSDRGAAAFAGADADAIFERQDEDFAVADGAGFADTGRMDDGFDSRFDESVVDGDFELQFGQEANLEFLPAIHFREPALPAAAAHVADGHEIDIVFVEGPLHGLQFFGPNDGDDHFHGRGSSKSKIQITNSKCPNKSKSSNAKHSAALSVGDRVLRFVWDLFFGHWDFAPRHSVGQKMETRGHGKRFRAPGSTSPED